MALARTSRGTENPQPEGDVGGGLQSIGLRGLAGPGRARAMMVGGEYLVQMTSSCRLP